MKVYQGDQYAVPITVKRNGAVHTANDIEKLEVIFGGIRKEYPGDIMYHAESETFLFPLSQDETMNAEDENDILTCPKFKDGTITGWIKQGGVTWIEMEGAEVI